MSHLLHALRAEPLPAAVVDMDALDHNLSVLLQATGARCSLRIASKSVRCVHLLRYLQDRGGERMRGVMAMSPREALFLFEQGFDDILVAYPVARRADAAPFVQLCKRGARAWAMVDSVEHLELMQELAAEADVQVCVCLDLDMAWSPAPGIYLGARRSPVRTVGQSLTLAEHVERCSHLRLTAIMGYEAQVASMPDRSRGSAVLDALKRRIKAPSMRDVRRRRGAMVDAITQSGHQIEVVNGGGTGSLRVTSADDSVTEVTAGSGFFCPHLFDGFASLDLRPAAFFALPVSRRAAPDHITCHGGGYPASGGPGPDRWPMLHQRTDLHALGLEGWGEVQTPLKERRPGSVEVGDALLARHAKAGELCERFSELLLVRDGAIVERAKTYRGEGLTF